MARAAAAVIALALVLLASPMAGAQEGDTERLFTIYGIEVDVTSTTAARARQIALAQARREAFRLLVEKLVAPEAVAAVPSVGDEQLEQMVRAVQISNERTSSTRYLAAIDVTFAPAAMRALLSRAGVAYTESLGGPYLLLPLYEAGGRLRLFGEHAWRKALEAADPENRLIRYREPEPTLRNRVLLSPARLARVGPEALADLAAEFDVAAALLAHARPTVDQATGRRAVAFRAVTGPETGISLAETVIAREEEDLAALLERAADRLYGAADTDWKQRTLVSDRERREMTVLAPVRHLEDWIALRERLEGVSILRGSRIERIALPLSRLTLSYVGSEEQLALALSQARLVLAREGGRPVLRPREQAEALARAEAAREQAERAAEKPTPEASSGPEGGGAGDVGGDRADRAESGGA